MYSTRLERLQDKRFRRKVFILAIVNASLILFGIFGGIPLLSTLAGAFGALNSAKYTIDKTDILPPVPPQVFLPYEATNSAKQNLTGLAEPGSVVYLTYSNQPSISSVAKDDGKFQFNNLTLTTGGNIFQLVAVDKAGNRSQESPEITLNYSNKKPGLELNSPKIDHLLIEISGQTTTGVLIYINNAQAVVKPDGRFSKTFEVTEGVTEFDVKAIDRFGNVSEKQLEVTAKP